MGIGLSILLACRLMVASAFGSTMPWYVGQPVAQVNLESVAGALPEDNLEALLRVEEGEPLDLGAIRSDIALLVAAGGFVSVDAVVEPWVFTGVDGTAQPAVLVRYFVVPAKRVARIDVRGVRGHARRIVEQSHNFDLGDSWFGGEGLAESRAAILAELNRAGWPNADVSIVTDDSDGGIRVSIDVKLGEVVRIGTVNAPSDSPISERLVLKWMREVGVRPGQVLNGKDQESARLHVVDKLRDLGYDRPRVNVFIQDTADANRVALNVLISTGPQLAVEKKGRRLPENRLMREVLGVRAGDKVGQTVQRDAARRLKKWYADRGFLDAQVEVEAQQDGGDQTNILIRAKTGRRYWIVGLDWPSEMPIDRQTALRLIRESSPDILGAGAPEPSAIARSEDTVSDALVSKGYLDATVALSSRTGRPRFIRLPIQYGVPVRLEAQVELGPQVTLDDLRVLGGLGLEKETVKAWLQTNKGQPLSAQKTIALEQQIVEIYEEAGFLDVEAELITTRDSIRNHANVDIRVTPGQPVQLRSIVIRGNHRTKRHVVEREVMLEVGQPVAPSRLADTRSNLYNLDLFRLVSPDLVGDDLGSQDLLIRLQERPNILLEAGGGVSTDQGIRTTGRATHRNIAGLGHRLTGLGSVGYGWFGDEWRLDTATPVWRAASRYELPYVPGRGGRLVIEGLINETIQEPNWRMSRSGGSLGMKMRLSDRFEAVVDYRVQIRRLVDVDAGMLVNGDPWLPALGIGEDLVGQPILTSAPRVVSGGSLLLVQDGRDDRFNPRSGGNWSTHLEVGDGVFSGTVTMRASAKAERLVPIGPLVLDLVWRGGIGFAQGRSVTLPLEERFFLGGGTTLRGFSLNSVGPANFAARPEVAHPSQTESAIDGLVLPQRPAQWVATGGDAMTASTVELRIPLSVMGFHKMDSTSLVVFTDVGHLGFLDPAVVTTSRLDAADPPVRISFGTGLRVATPVGPASLDIGMNPFPISAREEALFMPHLSLGVF